VRAGKGPCSSGQGQTRRLDIDRRELYPVTGFGAV
jgi:hypothetical protein